MGDKTHELKMLPILLGFFRFFDRAKTAAARGEKQEKLATDGQRAGRE